MQCVVIMAGGSGTRLWPMSRKSKPKQLHNLVSDKTLIQETYDRVVKVVPAKQIFVSTTEKYVDEIRRQLPQVEKNNFIVEPASKNTAPSLGFIVLTLAISAFNSAILASNCPVAVFILPSRVFTCFV